MRTNNLQAAFCAVVLIPSLLSAQETVPDDDRDPLDQAVPVAAPEPEPEESPVIDTEELLLLEFARYRQQMDEKNLDEADVTAKRIVELAIRVYGARSRETASALNNLGVVQHASGQFDAAIQNFQSSIEIIEVVEDRLNSALINPLKGLGAAQLSIGRPDQANKTFTRAAHITHVNEGPHNLDQVEILESKAETLIRMGEIDDARNVLDRIHVINLKYYAKDPLGLLPSLMNRAAWQHRAGYYNDERATYRRAIRIVESGSGKNDPLLIDPLLQLGESFYYIDQSGSSSQYVGGVTATGELYFKRAVRVAEANKDIDWNKLVDAKLALGDYYMFSESFNRAKKMYSEVWNFLSLDEQRIARRDELFAQPVVIRERQLPLIAGGPNVARSSQDNVRTGKVVVNYAVSTQGRVRNLRTEVSPKEFGDMARLVHREVRSRSFRPRIENGDPVDAAEEVLVHEFSYLQSDLDAIRTENAAAADAITE